MVNVNSIHVYDKASRLIDENTTAAEYENFLQALPADESGNNSRAVGILETLEDDYEDYKYILFDYQRIVMTLNGDVVTQWDSVAEFIQDTVNQIAEVIAAE